MDEKGSSSTTIIYVTTYQIYSNLQLELWSLLKSIKTMHVEKTNPKNEIVIGTCLKYGFKEQTSYYNTSLPFDKKKKLKALKQDSVANFVPV